MTDYTWLCLGCRGSYSLDNDPDGPPVCIVCRRKLPQGYQSQRGRTHLPDPFLPPPENNWDLDPWGWTVYTMCGLMVHKAQEAATAEDICHKCAAKALRP